MNREWSRQIAAIMNSPAMAGKSQAFRAAFLKATEKVESADALPDRWKAFLRQAITV